MLFIREYDTKSLDRSSVSMIDKYNTRLNKVDELLDELSSTIDILLSLVRDIRNTLGQCKQRIYNNLDQVKEVVSGNGITGTENTINAIESALKAGDKAINEAEAQLENIKVAIDNNEEYCNDTNVGVMCGELPDGTEEDDCSYCSHTYVINTNGDPLEESCAVCQQGDCIVDVNCDEEKDENSAIAGFPTNGCMHSEAAVYEPSCSQIYTVNVDGGCGEVTCNHPGETGLAPPDGCPYTCIDNGGCGNAGDDCSYGTVCGQEEPCNEISCGQYDCGEPCGETCHMTIECSLGGDSSEDSCGEDCGDYSDVDYYGGDDCGQACGENCGDSCGLF